MLPADKTDDFLKTAIVSGFEVHEPPAGRWPKLTHRETKIEVGVLPEGSRPGTPSHLAPTTIPHPKAMGGSKGTLSYANLPSLIELKLAAGRLRDQADIVELLRVNPDRLDEVRRHLQGVHSDYAARLEPLLLELE